MYQPGKAVCDENKPVGTGHTSQPAADSTGMATPQRALAVAAQIMHGGDAGGCSSFALVESAFRRFVL